MQWTVKKGNATITTALFESEEVSLIETKGTLQRWKNIINGSVGYSIDCPPIYKVIGTNVKPYTVQDINTALSIIDSLLTTTKFEIKEEN